MVKSKTKSGFTIHGVGRRKTAVARVWMKKGSGSIVVNGKDSKNYFNTDITRELISSALKVAQLEKDFDIKVNVGGGGVVGQAEATRLGIARALLTTDESLRPSLKKNGLLRVDDRIKERKKYGQKGARKKFQFTKR